MPPPDTAWWVVARVYDHRRNRVEDDVFITEFALAPLLARWISGRRPGLPAGAFGRFAGSSSREPGLLHSIHDGPASLPGRARTRERPRDHVRSGALGPVAPERFGVLQSLLAYLLTACGEEKEAVIPARDLIDRFSIPAEELEEHLSLLNLVNFGGGCYAVYAELHGDEVHVDKELFGDTFRRAPRLTPLEARAIRLALEFVGPMSFRRHGTSPLERVRARSSRRPSARSTSRRRPSRTAAPRRISSRRSRARSTGSASSSSST